ncbi:MAG: hypothetical protein J6M22_00540 [Firmicutes bacterium]|nr:hypothetical protein [Bacillota bacterium]
MKVKETQLEYRKKYELSPEEIKAINVGIEDMKAGRGRPIEDFLKEMKASLGI